MQLVLKILVIFLLLGTLTSCLKTATTNEIYSIQVIGDVPSNQIENIQDVLSTNAPLAMKNLGVREMPSVKIMVWQDKGRFADEFGEDAINTRGFINSENWEVHVLNVGAPLGRKRTQRLNMYVDN